MVYTYVENGKIIVDVAKEHTPKCSISKPRVLFENELEDIYMNCIFKENKENPYRNKQPMLQEIKYIGMAYLVM